MVDLEVMTYGKLIKKYPEMEDDINLLYRSKSASLFWSVLGAFIIGVLLGWKVL